MFRILIILAVLFVPGIAAAANCAPGYYLDNGECVECPMASYCPGDDAHHLCRLIAVEPNNMVSVAVHGRIMLTDASQCWCQWLLKSPNSRIVLAYQYGFCVSGPVGDFALGYNQCAVGYRAVGNNGSVSKFKYTDCVSCTNLPANAEYIGYGTPVADDETEVGDNCLWKCDDGYMISSDGAECAKLCGLGYTKLNTSTGIVVPLYADKRTTPSINIGDVNAACHADLAPGRASGEINVMYNGTVYHTISQKIVSQCEKGYWLNGDGVCDSCGQGYYCIGDNKRQSCRDLIPDEDLQYLITFYGVSNGVWGATYTAMQVDDCVCGWRGSDETRTYYYQESRCYQGRAGPEYNTYSECRTGYYAIGPVYSYNRYTGCAPCTNGPANSHYTSYSTPSVAYAVESNCPWECDDGYTQVGNECVAE